MTQKPERLKPLPSDNLCKTLAEKYPEQFVEWLFGLKVSKLKIVKTELSREPIRADAAIQFETAEELFHLEFQTTPKSKQPLPMRMLDYKVGFKRVHPNKRIRQVLIVLKNTGEAILDRYEDEDTLHKYEVRRMWEEEPDDLMRFKGLLPLATLCKTDSGETLLQKVAQRVSKESIKEERREMLRMSQVFAGLRYDKNLIYRILKEGDMLEESVVVQDWIQRGLQQGVQQGMQQGVQQGLQQGMQQGLQQGERNLVLRQLTQRFGKLSVKARKQIDSLSLKQLEKLGIALLDFQSKTELTAWLNQHCKEHA